MKEIMSFAGVLGYICIGVFVSGLIQEPWEKPSVMLMLLWPLVLFLFILFGLLDALYELGKKLKEKLFK